MASESGVASPSSRLARTDELRLKNVTIKTFLPDSGVHHTSFYPFSANVSRVKKLICGTIKKVRDHSGPPLPTVPFAFLLTAIASSTVATRRKRESSSS